MCFEDRINIQNNILLRPEGVRLVVAPRLSFFRVLLGCHLRSCVKVRLVASHNVLKCVMPHFLWLEIVSHIYDIICQRIVAIISGAPS